MLKHVSVNPREKVTRRRKSFTVHGYVFDDVSKNSTLE